jgi:hypothetical protein
MTSQKRQPSKPRPAQSDQPDRPEFLPPLRPRPVLFWVLWIVLLLWLGILVWMKMKTVKPQEAVPAPVLQNQIR